MAGEIALTAKKEEETASSWSDLPIDILSSILVRLPTVDCRSFRSTCNSWGSMPGVARPLLSPFDSLLADSPCLGNFYGFPPFRFWNPKQNNTYQLYLPTVPYSFVRSSGSNGWLLMSGPAASFPAPMSVYLINPIIRSMFRPPTTPEVIQFRRLCFTSEPTSSDCSIFGISEPKLRSIRIGMINRGELHWTIFQFRSRFEASSNPVFHKGRYYCLESWGKVGEFDPEERSWNVHSTSPEQYLRYYERKYTKFMVTTEEEVLLAVFVSFNYKDVCILKLDVRNMIWHKISCLEGKALYISEKGCFAKSAATEERGNKIYYPAPRALSECLIYSLDTQTWETVHEAYRDHQQHLSEYKFWIESSQEIV